MANFWCKVCGHKLDTVDGAVVSTCVSCGARQVLPIPLSGEYLKYYAELVMLQQSERFEQAEELFEHLLLEGGADAALYWLGVLIDHKAVYKIGKNGYAIVCGKASETSVAENEFFQKVLHYASPAQRGIFENDGSMLEISRLESLGKYEAAFESEQPLNKGFLCLEDGAWDAAAAQFDRVLNDDPENALAYFGKMMAELQVRREGELTRTGMRLIETENYNNVLKYGDKLLCDRLEKYRISGILYQATEHSKCAVTVDDWKHVKKLLMEIRENERAREYLALCDRKIRAIMVREAQLVIGCREAANLGITTDTLGTRMVSANYYYDFDMSYETSKDKQKKFKPPSSRAVAIAALIVLVILVLLFSLPFLLGGRDDDEREKISEISHTEESVPKYSDSLDEKLPADKKEADISGNKAFCVAGNMAFTLDGNGNVVCLSEINDSVSIESTESDGTQNGASFTPNATPYASDYNTWSDVAALYGSPDGEVLFGVMKNGTVAYDIFSSSNMNYEAAYKPVSSWMNVSHIVWESGDIQNPLLFAVTKDGNIYISDIGLEKKLNQMLDKLKDKGFFVETLCASDSTVHILMTNGGYLSVKYKDLIE